MNLEIPNDQVNLALFTNAIPWTPLVEMEEQLLKNQTDGDEKYAIHEGLN